eukprot:SAG31_NODE_12334_length_949_cov_1.156471_2_plen_56_part_00
MRLEVDGITAAEWMSGIEEMDEDEVLDLVNEEGLEVKDDCEMSDLRSLLQVLVQH